MLIVKILIAYIIGIILAECSNYYVPAIILLISFVSYLFVTKANKMKTFYPMVVGLSCLLSLQDKAHIEDDSQPYRISLDRVGEVGFSEQTAGVTRALLFGDKKSLSARQKKSMRDAGMSHIMAVSGLHVGIMAIVLSLFFFPIRLFGWFNLHKIAVVLVIWCYVLAIGHPVSAVRAALMLSLSSMSWILHRETTGVPILASSAMIMLLYDTQQLWDVGFQLSYLSVLGIIMAKPLYYKQNWLWQYLVVTVSAQIATAPLVAYYFHIVPIFGWVQGLLVVPVLPIFVYLLIANLCFPGVVFLLRLAELFSEWLFFVAEKTTLIELWCLGGRILWYPDIYETIALETCCLSLLYLFSQRGKHPACGKNVFSA